MKKKFPSTGLVVNIKTGETKKVYRCQYCGEIYPEFFRVNNSIWKKIKMGGAPCISCFSLQFQKTFRRKMLISDFVKNVKCNQLVFFGYKLGNNFDDLSVYVNKMDEKIPV